MAVAPPSGSEAQYTQAASTHAPRGLLEKIEDFYSRPGFTDSISDFASQHSAEFSEPNEGEHPVSRRLSRTAAATVALASSFASQHPTAATHRRHTPPPHTAATHHRNCCGIIPLLSCLTCNSFDGTRSTCSTRRS